ncbi:hypothetical protein [Nocardia sp. NPDC051463]|uniref:hypothetical protein n=1 Tax=Nocardia sp. NPDC051463 TaxID=3154845 RepID=UPI00344C8A16
MNPSHHGGADHARLRDYRIENPPADRIRRHQVRVQRAKMTLLWDVLACLTNLRFAIAAAGVLIRASA